MRVRHDSGYELVAAALFIALLASVAVFLTACGPEPDPAQEATAIPTYQVEVPGEVEATLEANSAVTVTVSLGLPAADASIQEQLQQIAQAQDRLLSQIPARDFALVYRFQTTPALVGVLTKEGLRILRDLPGVRAIALNTAEPAALIESATVIRAHEVWRDFGLTGAGVNIALLDTGVDNEHPDLAGKIGPQQCFVACANGDRLNAQDDNGHGTHVAGIIASRGTVSPRGIAPDAGIIAIRVVDTTGTDRVADVLAGIEWVLAHQTDLDVRIMNLRLRRDSYSGECDAELDDPGLVDALQRVRQAGIIVFAPAGNGAEYDRMSAPACLSSVVSVGSTTKADQVSWGSNSSSALDLLAPGEQILSTALGGGCTDLNGTSHASPHAAAVAALMLQAKPDLPVAEIERILRETGVLVTDHRNNRVTPRIDAWAAVSRVVGEESK